MAVQHLSPQIYGIPAPHTAPAAADSYSLAAPRGLMSFLDGPGTTTAAGRAPAERGRPLAWRAGLPLPAWTCGAKEPAVFGPDVAAIHDSADDSADDTQRCHSARITRAASEHLACLRYDVQDFVQSLVWANHDMLQTRPSQLEGPQQRAVYVKADNADCALPSWLATTGGELLHVHADGSAHMVLSLPDAATAVERGWAENALAAGVPADVRLFFRYVAVYAPRNTVELAVWKRLALASVRYGTAHVWNGQVRRPEQL